MPALTANLLFVLSLVLLVVKIGALIDCAVRPARDFEVRGTLQKNGWLLILAVAVLAHLFLGWSPIGIFNIVGTVAALVYLAQLRGTHV